jgi:hypothetical protein
MVGRGKAPASPGLAASEQGGSPAAAPGSCPSSGQASHGVAQRTWLLAAGSQRAGPPATGRRSRPGCLLVPVFSLAFSFLPTPQPMQGKTSGKTP